jgi:hypothetical protein
MYYSSDYVYPERLSGSSWRCTLQDQLPAERVSRCKQQMELRSTSAAKHKHYKGQYWPFCTGLLHRLILVLGVESLYETG